jgi:LmbE family N-acetylglucosaminyl deacetylase
MATYTKADVAKLGTILGVWAHPDDESWMSGGLMAAAVANGQRVVCVTATRGDAGQTADEARWPQAKLSQIREQECGAALAALGITEHHWLDFGDGTLAGLDPAPAVAQLVKLISEVQPTTMLTFGPDGFTGHPDHATVSRWAVAAAGQVRRPPQVWWATEGEEKYQTEGLAVHKLVNLYFATDRPQTVPQAQADLWFELDESCLTKKLASLEAQPSQMQHLFSDPARRQAITNYAASECFVMAKPTQFLAQHSYLLKRHY